MINLLPYDKKNEIRAGRANVIIVNYLVLTACGVALLAGIMGAAYLMLTQTHSNATQRVEQSEQAASEFAKTRQAADEFRKNLATAKQMMDNSVVYSELVLKVAKAIPAGVYLDSLDLSPETVGKPTNLTAHARSLDRAIALKTSLEGHTELFSDVHFQTVAPSNTSESEADSSNGYPVQINIVVTIKKEALQ